MSADWFCKIGEKKVGPLNGQQLKTIVAKGQLKREHLVRRGSEGPWVPAGRVKGLFPEGAAGGGQSQGKKPPQATAKPLPKAGSPPKAASLPTAAEAPAPPAADIPQELRLGGHHKHHVEMNVDSLNIEASPVSVSRRKVRSGMQGLKKSEQKKLTIMLMCLIGGGMTFGLIVMIWGVATGKFSKSEEAKLPAALAPAADSGGKQAEKDAASKKPAADKEESWKKAGIEKTLVGDVEVMVLKPLRGGPPKGAKTEESEVLIVPVNLNLVAGVKKAVDLTSWADKSLKKKVLLKDDQDKTYDLLEQVASVGSDGTAIPPGNRIQVQLIFPAPSSKKLKTLQLKLPPAAFHGEGPMICYNIDPSEIRVAPAKAAETENADGDSGDNAPKTAKKKSANAKPADADEGDSADNTPKTAKKKSADAKPADADEGDSAESPPKPTKKKTKAKSKPADDADAN
jgi:hypothetical protein